MCELIQGVHWVTVQCLCVCGLVQEGLLVTVLCLCVHVSICAGVGFH